MMTHITTSLSVFDLLKKLLGLVVPGPLIRYGFFCYSKIVDLQFAVIIDMTKISVTTGNGNLEPSLGGRALKLQAEKDTKPLTYSLLRYIPSVETFRENFYKLHWR